MASEIEQREQPHVGCSSCGRKFRYPPEMAGHTVRCQCGSAIRIPMPHDPDESDEYDLAPEPEVKRGAGCGRRGEGVAGRRAGRGAGGGGRAAAGGGGGVHDDGLHPAAAEGA